MAISYINDAKYLYVKSFMKNSYKYIKREKTDTN